MFIQFLLCLQINPTSYSLTHQLTLIILQKNNKKVGETMVWFEKCDFKLRKYHFNLRFLLDCKNNGVMPKSPHFKLGNRHLKNSHVYKNCQTRELEEEINQSKRGLIPWKKIHGGFRKNYKEDFRFQIFLVFVLCFQSLMIVHFTP